MTPGARTVKREAGRKGRKAARSRSVKRLGRLGFVAKGLIYMLVAALAFAVAVGAREDAEGQSGAIATVSEAPLGKALLIATAVGLLGYALWRLTLAVLGPPWKEEATDVAERVGSGVLAIVYGGLSAYAVGIAFGARANGASAGPDDATRLLLDQPLGAALVVVLGLVLAGVAAFEAHKAVTRGFLDELATSRMSARQKRTAIWLGTVGHGSRAVVSALIAGFVIKAALEHDPEEAIGLDGALHKLVSQPAGPPLLGLVAAGLFVFGAYCLAEARFRRL